MDIPFSEKKPLLFEGGLYIPSHSSEHGGFSLPFPEGKNLAAEFCSGNGEWIVERAKAFPGTHWIAVEKRFDRAKKIWARGKREGVKNLFTVYGDAKTFTEFYLPEGSLSEVYVNFPDPWPKRRHAKYRLIQRDFARLLQRAVKPQGEAVLVTDNPDYSSTMIAVMSEEWRPFYPPPYYVHEWGDFGKSYFLSLWQEKRKKIYYHRFVNDRRS